MSYVFSGLIETSDFNNFLAGINEILTDFHSNGIGTDQGGYGYGQLVNTGLVFVGNEIRAGEVGSEEEWASLFNDVNTVISHQSDITPYPQTFIDDEITLDMIIAAYPSLIDNIAQARANRFQVGIQTDVTANLVSSSRTVAWDGIIEYQFTASATNWNDLRYFFNSGGTITISPTYVPDGATDIENTWNSIITDLGTFVFDYTDTLRTGTNGQSFAIGFYDLTEEDSELWFIQAGTPVGTETATFRARLNDSPGIANQIIFTLTYLSSVDGIPVPGTMGASVAESVASATGPLSIVPLTYNLDIGFDEGGIFLPFDATLTSDNFNQSCVIFGSCPSMFTITANPIDPIGTVTYEWSFVENPDGDFIIAGPNDEQVIMLQAGRGSEPLNTVATLQCKLTDNGRVTDPIFRTVIVNNSADYSTADVIITNITLNSASIYSGTGGTAAGSRTCSGVISCSNTFNLVATIGGPDAGNSTTTWQFLDDAGGKFTALTQTAGLATSTSNNSDSASVGLIELKVQSDRPGGDEAVVIVTLDSIHIISGSSLSAVVSLPGGTPTCTLDTTCSVRFTANVNASGGSPPYTYNWSLLFLGPAVYSIESGQGSASIIVISDDADILLPEIEVQCEITDFIMATDTDSKTITPVRNPPGITSIVINGESPTPLCSYDRDAPGNPTFCVATQNLMATVEGGSGMWDWDWSISGQNVDDGYVYFGTPGTTTSLDENPELTTTNDGIDPDPDTKENVVSFEVQAQIFDQTTGELVATSSPTTLSAIHKDITNDIIIGSLVETGGTCVILADTCLATSTFTVSMSSGAPDVFGWTLVSNPGNKFSFLPGGETTFVLGGSSIQVISDTSDIDLNGVIRVEAAKVGQNNYLFPDKAFDHNRTFQNALSMPSTLRVGNVNIYGFSSPKLISSKVRFFPDGSFFAVGNNVVEYEWISNGHPTIGNDYQIKYTVLNSTTPDSSPAHNAGIWRNLSSLQEYSVSITGNGEKTSIIDITIRLQGSSNTVIDTMTTTLTVTQEP